MYGHFTGDLPWTMCDMAVEEQMAEIVGPSDLIGCCTRQLIAVEILTWQFIFKSCPLSHAGIVKAPKIELSNS